MECVVLNWILYQKYSSPLPYWILVRQTVMKYIDLTKVLDQRYFLIMSLPWEARVLSSLLILGEGVQSKLPQPSHSPPQQQASLTLEYKCRAKANGALPREHTGHSKLSSNNARDDSTLEHHQMVNNEIRLITFFAAEDGEALYRQQKQDQELTVAQIMNSLLPHSDLNWRK